MLKPVSVFVWCVTERLWFQHLFFCLLLWFMSSCITPPTLPRPHTPSKYVIALQNQETRFEELEVTEAWSISYWEKHGFCSFVLWKWEGSVAVEFWTLILTLRFGEGKTFSTFDCLCLLMSHPSPSPRICVYFPSFRRSRPGSATVVKISLKFEIQVLGFKLKWGW